MAYIGRQSGQIGNYIRCNTITPDGSTTTFALTNVLDSTAVFPGGENNVLCSLSGVIQAPGSGNAFTINGSNIVFDSAPTAADTIDFVIVLGNTVDIGTPSDNTVTMAKINGIPMIERVWRQGINSKVGDVYVACSEDEVFNLIDCKITLDFMK